jgi:natural resistance-associated macrophage protein
MNDLLNCLMSLMLPFAVIPTITFTSNRKIMGDFVNGLVSRIFSVLLSILLVTVNTYFVIQYVMQLGENHTWARSVLFILFLVFFGVVYLLFCLYLTIDMALAMGGDSLASVPIIQRIFSFSTTQGNYAIHGDEDDDESNSSEMEDIEGAEERVSDRP